MITIDDFVKRNNFPKRYNILGVDPSLTGTGLCVLEYPNRTLVHVETVATHKMRGMERLLWIEDFVVNYLKKYTPFLVGIEGYAFGARGQAGISLGELGGILRRAIYAFPHSYIEVPPNSLKKFVCGKGNAGKNVMLEQTFRNFGLGSEQLTDDNQVDAYCLARCVGDLLLYKKGESLDIPKIRLEAFTKLKEIKTAISYD